MNTFRYVGIDGLDEMQSHVFHAEQSISELRDLQKADYEHFHYMIMGNQCEYLDYLGYYVSPYTVDVLTVEIASALENQAIENDHVEAKKVNFCYDQIKKLGIDIIHPRRPTCNDFETCEKCPADGVEQCEIMKYDDHPDTDACPDCGIEIPYTQIRCAFCHEKYITGNFT